MRTPGGPGPQQHSQPPRPQGGGSWASLRDSVRRDVEQAAGALAFAAALHDRLESQRRLFADFPRVMEQLRSGALERVATALARLFEGKEQFDLTRFLRDLPLALGQLAAAEAARKSAPREPAPAEAAPAPAAAGDEGAVAAPPGETAAASEAEASAEPGSIATAEGLPTPPSVPISTPPSVPILTSDATATATATSNPTSTPTSNLTSTSTPISTPIPTPSQFAGQPVNGGAPAEPPSPRLELRSRLLAAAPQLGKAVVTYRRTVATVRRAAAPRRAPGPWRSDREVLEEARQAVDFARQLFDAYAEAWADQPTQPGSGEAMSAETDRFLAWTQLARYMDVAAPRSQPPPPTEKAPDKPSEKGPDKQPVTQGSAGAGAPPPEAETAHRA
ncbi:MAG TPA: hypothetical protein VF973_03790 [Myxococcales bacterium]